MNPIKIQLKSLLGVNYQLCHACKQTVQRKIEESGRLELKVPWISDHRINTYFPTFYHLEAHKISGRSDLTGSKPNSLNFSHNAESTLGNTLRFQMLVAEWADLYGWEGSSPGEDSEIMWVIRKPKQQQESLTELWKPTTECGKSPIKRFNWI